MTEKSPDFHIFCPPILLAIWHVDHMTLELYTNCVLKSRCYINRKIEITKFRHNKRDCAHI